MFDIGFFEVCLIGVIALLVIGPEKLPKVARTTGLWIGKVQGLVKTVKHQVDEQVRMEELKQSIQQQADTLEDTLNTSIQSADSQINEAVTDLNDSIQQTSRSEKPNPPPSTKQVK